MFFAEKLLFFALKTLGQFSTFFFLMDNSFSKIQQKKLMENGPEFFCDSRSFNTFLTLGHGWKRKQFQFKKLPPKWSEYTEEVG